MDTKNLLHGGSVSPLYGSGLVDTLTDALDTASYKFVQQPAPRAIADSQATTNSLFWRAIRENRAYSGQVYQLKNFYLSEWLPMSPGLFHSPDAASRRAMAEEFLAPEHGLHTGNFWKEIDLQYYQRHISNRQYFANQFETKAGFAELMPNGKAQMVHGGIGSLRLAPKRLFNNEEVFILGASQNGIMHEGVPVLFSASMYYDIVDQLKSDCGLLCTLTGRLSILPDRGLPIQYPRSHAKYCLWVEEITRISGISVDEIMISTALTFSPDLRQVHNKQWSFVTFHPDANDRNLSEAAEWLYDYAKRYSNSDTPVIMCDFDEYKDHFDRVDFPLKDLANGHINLAKLAEFKDLFEFKIVNIMGDNINNNSGTIVNRSVVKNSFNNVSGVLDNENVALLKSITSAVEQSGNKEAVEQMEAFNDELNKTEPKKSLLKAFWNGVVAAVPALISNADKVVDLIEKIGKHVK